MALDIQAIVEDGFIDDSEVAAIRAEIFGDDGEDGSDVSEGEFRMVDQIKNSVEYGQWVPAFEVLYIEAGVNYAARDGEVDANEAAVLNEIIGADGMTDALEEHLLISLRASGATIHPSLMG